MTHPTYAFYKNNFPTLQKPSTSNSTPSSTTQQAMATNSTKMATNSNEEKPPLQPRSHLKMNALQAQIQKNLATDFTNLLNAPKWNIFTYQQFVCQN